MGRFKHGDETDRQLTQVMVHEFALAESAFQRFKSAGVGLVLAEDKYRYRFEAYNAYADLICRLFEFFTAAICREYRDTKLREFTHEQRDELLTMEARKYFRNKREMIAAGYHETTDNAADYYEYEVPDTFGTHMRAVRNNHHHSDYRRAGDVRITLIQFYQRYHKALLGLLHQSGFWSMSRLGDFKLDHIDKFNP